MSVDSGGPAPDGVSRRSVLRRGAAASVALAGLGTGVASAQPYGGWFTDDAPGGATSNYDGTTVDRTGEDSITITVGADGNDGSFAYDPPAVRIDPGTEVVFDWASDTHNLVLKDGPDGGWSGYDEIQDAGFEHSHTFETEGVYKYYCEPHLTLGMKGAVAVGSDVPTVTPTPAPSGDGESDGDDGGGLVGPFFDGSSPIVSATLGFLTVSVGAVFAGELLGALDEWRAEARAAIEETDGEVVEAPETESARELDHDSFVPRGTWTLVLVYLLILATMWVFTYFVEFLGREPTVIG